MKTIKYYNTFLYLLSCCLLALVGCKKEPNPSPIPEPPGNLEEVITTMKITFTDSASGNSTSYFFKDPDGDGGQTAFYGPTATSQSDSTIALMNNHTYSLDVVLLDETKNPVSVISEDVAAEAQDHMLFYNQDNISIISNADNYIIQINNGCRITYLDMDDGTPQRPLGLKTKWRTGNQQPKSLLNITLKHQPGVKDGTFAPGDSDISVNFKLEIN